MPTAALELQGAPFVAVRVVPPDRLAWAASTPTTALATTNPTSPARQRTAAIQSARQHCRPPTCQSQAREPNQPLPQSSQIRGVPLLLERQQSYCKREWRRILPRRVSLGSAATLQIRAAHP